jgi:hypothetical protein
LRTMTKPRYVFVCAVAWCLLFLIPEALAQTLQIIDTDGRSTTISKAQVASLSHTTVDVRDHDKPAQFEGVPLAPLLAMAGIQLGDSLRGPRMSDVLLVEALDGYRVVFALAEVDPAFATREIILADKRDGKSLDAREGPWRIVAPGDKRPVRWIRQVVTLKIISAR